MAIPRRSSQLIFSLIMSNQDIRSLRGWNNYWAFAFCSVAQLIRGTRVHVYTAIQSESEQKGRGNVFGRLRRRGCFHLPSAELFHADKQALHLIRYFFS